MEDKASLIRTKGRAGGCPTRLQKHAPASLEIDKVLSERPSNPFGEASNAIPLLSPLVISPQILYAETVEQNPNAQNSGGNEGWSSSSKSNTPNTGWKHPAMAPFPEPSSLCSFLQKQCVIVNNTQ
ncbi:uncharacterized protein LOC130744996 [Lotus japonicus]|uniref:uncharacterized protein LOC130744996 n=1 Tax=Lotus japonicus TaxID=34305 RepID=UPI00258C336D|nr:uncharacterized protein LOC130744996 [Lotus japonicus]